MGNPFESFVLGYVFSNESLATSVRVPFLRKLIGELLDFFSLLRGPLSYGVSSCFTPIDHIVRFPSGVFFPVKSGRSTVFSSRTNNPHTKTQKHTTKHPKKKTKPNKTSFLAACSHRFVPFFRLTIFFRLYEPCSPFRCRLVFFPPRFFIRGSSRLFNAFPRFPSDFPSLFGGIPVLMFTQSRPPVPFE